MASTSFSFSSSTTSHQKGPPSMSGTATTATSSSNPANPLTKYTKLWELLWPRFNGFQQSPNSLFYMKKLEVPPMASTANFRDSIVPSAEISGPAKESEAYFMDMRRLPGYPSTPYEVALPCRAEQMVVTEDYVRLLYRLTQIDRSRSQKATASIHHAHVRRGAVIVGNSGIGKTYFLSYLLVVRLRHAKPTVFYEGASYYYLFNADGVAKVQIGSDDDFALPDDCWVLCDNCPPWQEAAWNRNCFFIQVSGPDEFRYSQWKTQFNAKCFYMDTWSWPEIIALSSLHPKANIKQYWQAAFAFGFIPRFVEKIASNPAEFEKEFKEHYREVVCEIGNIVKAGHQFMLENVMSRGGVSRTVAIRPRSNISASSLQKRPLKDRRCPDYSILTPYIRAILTSVLHEQCKGGSIFAMSRYMDNDVTRSALNLIFESYCHLLFELSPAITDPLMMEVTLNSMESTAVDHHVPALTKLILSHHLKTNSRRFETIHFSSLRELGENLRLENSWKLREDRLFVYFKPEIRLLAPIDALMLVRDGYKVYTVFFQGTLGPLRPIKAQMLADVWSEIPVAARKNGGFVVYVTPMEPYWHSYPTSGGDNVSTPQSFIGDDGTWGRIIHQMKLSVSFERLFMVGAGQAHLTGVGLGDYFSDLFGNDNDEKEDRAESEATS